MLYSTLAVYRNCEEILGAYGGKAKVSANRDNEWAIDPDQAGGYDIFPAFCDFSTSNGIGITQVEARAKLICFKYQVVSVLIPDWS